MARDSLSEDRCADPLCRGSRNTAMQRGDRFGIHAMIHATCYGRRQKRVTKDSKPSASAGASPLPFTGSIDQLDPAAASRAIRALWGDSSAASILMAKK